MKGVQLCQQHWGDRGPQLTSEGNGSWGMGSPAASLKRHRPSALPRHSAQPSGDHCAQVRGAPVSLAHSLFPASHTLMSHLKAHSIHSGLLP